MYKVIVKGLAGSSNIDDRSKLDGVDCQDNFSEYFHRSYNYGGGIIEINQQPLIDKGVTGGYMKFKYKNGKLYVIVEYNSRSLLDDMEVDILKKYTSGQMSDGIGEGFEQYSCMEDNGNEIFLSPWFRGQVLTVVQTEI